MSVLTALFARAKAELELAPEADASTVKRAYRRKTLEHPPDQDPEGFRRIRDAYETLSNPIPAARQALFHPMPHVAPPDVPAPQAPTEPLVFELLRQVVASLPAEQLESHLSLAKPGKPKSS